jgi:hypothetical protein
MRPIRLTIGTGMVAVAIVAVACAGLLLLAQTWGLLSEVIGAYLPDLGGFNGMGLAIALAVTLPWLFVWLGLVLFRVGAKTPIVNPDSEPASQHDPART